MTRPGEETAGDGIIHFGEASSRDDVVSEFWLRLRMVEAVRAAGRALAEDNETDAAEHSAWCAAIHAAWRAMARDGIARAGDLLDVADLHVAGRGSVAELSEAAARNEFVGAPRDDEEAIDLATLRRLETVAEDAALAADIVTADYAMDILESHLRFHARLLADRRPGPPSQWFAEQFSDTIDSVKDLVVGAMAWRALSKAGPVKMRDLSDVIAVYRAQGGGSLTTIVQSVLAGDFRNHHRESIRKWLINGLSTIHERRHAHRDCERWLGGSRTPRTSLH
jgi:hypothetical protein